MVKGLLKITKIILVLIAAAIIAGGFLIAIEIHGWHKTFIVNVRKAIPSKIGTEKIVADDYEEALPGGWCNGVTFKITEKTLKEIKAEGSDFFKGQKPIEQKKQATRTMIGLNGKKSQIP